MQWWMAKALAARLLGISARTSETLSFLRRWSTQLNFHFRLIFCSHTQSDDWRCVHHHWEEKSTCFSPLRSALRYTFLCVSWKRACFCMGWLAGENSMQYSLSDVGSTCIMKCFCEMYLCRACKCTRNISEQLQP